MQRFLLAPCIVGLILLGGVGQPARSALSGPQLLEIQFPPALNPSQTAWGSVRYRAPAGATRLQFDVVDGRFARLERALASPTTEGRARFSLTCTRYAQQVTLRVTLWDAQGRASAARLLRFDCGQPPRYDFSRALAETFPLTTFVRLNVFILDDGVTALTEGKQPTDDPLFAEPAPAVRAALQEEILPALSGIWDRCSLGFELGQVRILNPEALDLGGASLAEQLFTEHGGERLIRHSARTGAALQRARLALEGALRAAGRPLEATDLVAFVVGTRVQTRSNGSWADIEGFGETAPPTYALVRWGALAEQNGAFVLPRQMVATLAHELGHNLGLGHPGSDGLPDTTADSNNLMKGSGVTPEPRAHLLPSQCGRTAQTLAQLQSRALATAAQSADTAPPTSSAAPKTQLRWAKLEENQAVSGTVRLELVAEGLEGFSFAEFAYSTDGNRFVEIGVDRDPRDGLAVSWDTSTLPGGRYLVRATVTDARRRRATTTLWLEVRG